MSLPGCNAKIADLFFQFQQHGGCEHTDDDGNVAAAEYHPDPAIHAGRSRALSSRQRPRSGRMSSEHGAWGPRTYRRRRERRRCRSTGDGPHAPCSELILPDLGRSWHCTLVKRGSRSVAGWDVGMLPMLRWRCYRRYSSSSSNTAAANIPTTTGTSPLPKHWRRTPCSVLLELEE
jgi:hypothetical protein